MAWSRSGMIDTFRYLKVSAAPTAITSQVQSLSHSNTALPNMVNAVNANQVADRHQAEAKVT